MLINCQQFYKFLLSFFTRVYFIYSSCNSSKIVLYKLYIYIGTHLLETKYAVPFVHFNIKFKVNEISVYNKSCPSVNRLKDCSCGN